MNPSQQNSNTDQTANFFWLLVILAGFALIAWYLEKKYIVTGIFYVRHYEIWLLQKSMTAVNSFLKWLSWPQINLSSLNYWQNVIVTTTEPKEVVFDQVAALSHEVGTWLRYPLMAIVLGLSGWLFLWNRKSRFNHTYNMNSLKKLEVQNWPQITPVVNLKLREQQLDDGAWAMAKLPMDFCKENDLLGTSEDAEGKKIWIVKEGLAERLFVLQVGPMWQGVQSLPIHIKALIVIFVSRIQRENKVSDHFISQISHSAESGRLDFTGIEEALVKYENAKIIKWLEGRHAYVYTLMASLLATARAEGVLATAEFLWLKPVDRRLWYMLNSVGRQTAVVEVAGVFAHWLAEKRIKRRLRTPMVREAVVALDADIRNILYIADEDRWHTSLAA